MGLYLKAFYFDVEKFELPRFRDTVKTMLRKIHLSDTVVIYKLPHLPNAVVKNYVPGI